MISNILTNFFNCFTVPTLLLNYNFQTIFTHNHDSKIDISFYTSKAIEIVKNLNFISNTTSFNITNDISFSCISFNHYDNSKMYLLIGPYSTKELSNNNSEINILTEEWINNIIKLHTYIISNHIGKFNNLQNISPCVNHAIKYIEKNYSNYEKVVRSKSGGPATYIKLKGAKGKVGFISALSNCFCEDCNRIRLTPDGFLKQCLHFDYGVDLKSKLRENITDEELRKIIKDNIYDKPEKHLFLEKSTHKEIKFMNQIGG